MLNNNFIKFLLITTSAKIFIDINRHNDFKSINNKNHNDDDISIEKEYQIMCEILLDFYIKLNNTLTI